MDLSTLFEDFYKEFPELREESQLDMGKKVEKEHEPTVEWIENEVESTGETPPSKEIYASIAKDHLNEFPNYYTALDKMEKELKESSYIPAPKKGSPEYERVMRKWNSRRGMRMDDPDFEILKRILSDSAWEEETADEKEDYDVVHDMQEGVGDFVKGAAKQIGKSVGQTALNVAKKIPVVSNVVGGLEKAAQAGMQAHTAATATEATLQASDMEGMLKTIFDALKTYSTEPAATPAAQSQQPAKASSAEEPQFDNSQIENMQYLGDSFDLFLTLQAFEKEHLTEAGMDQKTFKNLVKKYVDAHAGDPMKVITDPAALRQLTGILDSAKKFGLNLPYSSKQLKDTLAVYQADIQPQAQTGEILANTEQQGTAATLQYQRFQRMTPILISILQDPNQSVQAMNTILKSLEAFTDKTGNRPAKITQLLKQLGSHR